jgi:sodium/proline symporter
VGDDNTYKLIGVVLYLSVLVFIGALASRRIGDVKDYYVGGKNMGFWAVAFSARATGESAWLLLGLTGMGAVVGIRGFWVVLGELVGVAGAWLLMSRRFKRLTDRYDSITVPDYLEDRFQDKSKRLRVVSAFSLVVFVTIYVAAQIYATGMAFNSFLGWNYYTGAFVGFFVVLLYASGGGFVAVVWSDVFQGTLMFLGLVFLPIIGVYHAGGVGNVVVGLREIDPSLLAWGGATGWTLETIFGTLALVFIGLGFLGSPQVFVRFIALRDESEIPKGAAVAIIWTLFADSGAVLTGMVGRYLLTGPGEDPVAILGKGGEEVLPIMVELVLPPMLVGLMIAIVLSAIMSTVDSLLVVASSAVVRDWYQQVKHPELPDDSLIPISRMATVGVALVALAVAMAATGPDQTVFWFVIFGWSGIAATFCPTIILSLFWQRFTANGALAAMVSGFICVPLFKFVVVKLPTIGPLIGALEELAPAFVISAVVGIVVSLLDSNTIDEPIDI